MDESLMTGAVFIDLSKTFDAVDHAQQLSKPSKMASKTEKCHGLVVTCLTESNMLQSFDMALKYSQYLMEYRKDLSLVH